MSWRLVDKGPRWGWRANAPSALRAGPENGWCGLPARTARQPYVFSVVGHRCRDAVISGGERSDVGACGQSRQNVVSFVLARIWASRQRCPTMLNRYGNGAPGTGCVGFGLHGPKMRQFFPHHHSLGYFRPHWARIVSNVRMMERLSSRGITELSNRPARRDWITSVASYR